MTEFLKIAFAVIIVVYLVVAAYFTLRQRDYIYYPDTAHYAPARANAVSFEPVPILIGDTTLTSWWRAPANDTAPILLYCHGNGGSLAYYVYELNDAASWGAGVLAVGYPGYGANPGAPSEETLTAAAKANYNWLIQSGVTPDRIVLYGHSLGSGVAADLAANVDAAGLILSSPFTSMVAMAQRLVPILPASLLLRDRYDTVGKIDDVRMPITIIHGVKDALIPFTMGKRVHARAAGCKTLVTLENAGHNNVWARGGGPAVQKAAEQFVSGQTCDSGIGPVEVKSVNGL